MILHYKRMLAFLTGTSLFVIFAVVLVSSLSRYLLNAPIQWSEEVARYAMIYGTMFGTGKDKNLFPVFGFDEL